MSNFEKAVEVLREAYREPSISPVHACDIMATALEAAGLFMPGLPAYSEADPGSAWWYAATHEIDEIGVGQLAKASPLRIVLRDYETGGVRYTDIQSAREYALNLLAACEYAEKEQDNEC